MTSKELEARIREMAEKYEETCGVRGDKYAYIAGARAGYTIGVEAAADLMAKASSNAANSNDYTIAVVAGACHQAAEEIRALAKPEGDGRKLSE
jgi:uncharacterized protein YmfQ (DUF2313 family)